MIFLISYEINEYQYDYSSLKEAIKSFGDYQHPMETVWFVKVPENTDANAIFEKLRQHFQDEVHDHIFVMEVAEDKHRQGWLPRSFWKWLRY